MSTLDPRAFVDSLELRGGGRRLVAAMIASIDGHAVLEGRSVPLGHPTDRTLLRELRTAVDVILVGTHTLASERYATLLDPEQRERRVDAGLAPHPLVATISRELEVPDVPLLHEDVPFVVYTESAGDGPGIVRRLPELTIRSVIEDLGAQAILCEGGPRLLREVVSTGLLDDLLLTISPLLAAGDQPTILTGEPFPSPVKLRLAEVSRADDHLFLHYTAA